MPLEVLEDTLEYSKKRDYIGYDKQDGISNKILQNIPIENKWLDILFQETIKRAPINLRPLLLVEQRPNFKGISLFLISNLNAYEETGNEFYLDEATELAEWLVENQSDQYDGFCGAYRHAYQGLEREKAEPHTPDIVCTSYGVRALLRMGKYDERYAEIASTAPKFIFGGLNYTESKSGAHIKYRPDDPNCLITLNINALAARSLLEIYNFNGEELLKERAVKLLDYVESQQTDMGGWMYRDPPSDSHLSMDNYHNGFIIESFYESQQLLDHTRYTSTIESALEFYKNKLYSMNGAPNWDEQKDYPRDIHAAAQGIIVFSITENIDFATEILQWTLNNLYNGHGRFYYQKSKYYTKRFTLMRWCQAWMAFAISTYISNAEGTPEVIE